jgi:hypothetical protein
MAGPRSAMSESRRVGLRDHLTHTHTHTHKDPPDQVLRVSIIRETVYRIATVPTTQPAQECEYNLICPAAVIRPNVGENTLGRRCEHTNHCRIRRFRVG